MEAELRAGRFPESRLDDPAYGEPGDQPDSCRKSRSGGRATES